MSRVKIDLPETFLAAFQIPVRITDINYGNHVGNDALAAIIHEARVKFLQQRGYSELDIGGKGLIMADLSIEFKRESFYNDTIEVQIAAGEISKVSFALYYRLIAKRKDNVIEIARAKTGMVCYDYANRKVAALPEEFKKIFT